MNEPILIYSQNISGGQSKLAQTNHKLATTHYDIILLQETWLTNKIDTLEIVHSTDFAAHRKDRDLLLAKRSKGGGVMCFFNKEFGAIDLTPPAITIADYQVTQITRNNHSLFIVNGYWPPQGNKKMMTNELIMAIRTIRKS